MQTLQYKHHERKHEDRVVGFLVVRYEAQLELEATFSNPSHLCGYRFQSLHGFGDLEDLVQYFTRVVEAGTNDLGVRSGVYHFVVRDTLPGCPQLRSWVEQTDDVTDGTGGYRIGFPLPGQRLDHLLGFGTQLWVLELGVAGGHRDFVFIPVQRLHGLVQLPDIWELFVHRVKQTTGFTKQQAGVLVVRLVRVEDVRV
ncbi:hypothetical protein D3C80_829080 [compost metagenome]